MKIQDDRTQAQKESHDWAVVGSDSFMSGWGEARGGKSYAAWAVPFELTKKVREWVENRSDMKRVRVVKLGDYKPKGQGHLHIYAVMAGHTALGSDSYQEMQGYAKLPGMSKA